MYPQWDVLDRRCSSPPWCTGTSANVWGAVRQLIPRRSWPASVARWWVAQWWSSRDCGLARTQRRGVIALTIDWSHPRVLQNPLG